ncbi:MAG: ABC transporter substrate-binding protein [Bacteroidetes bacterium]|nr:ABC transporter substrate-binding protein [Bacteroidota bacterium]
MNKYKISTFLLVLVFCSISFSQVNQNLIDNKFNAAVRLFEKSKYSLALEIFEWIIDNNKINSKTTVSYLFKAKSELRLNKFKNANITLNKLLQYYPDSKYRNEALLTLSKLYYIMKDYFGGMSKIIQLISETTLPYYVHYAKSTGKKIALNYLSSFDLIRIYDSSKSKIITPFILYLLGQIYFKEGDIQSSKNSFKEILNLYPKSAEYDDALNLYKHGGFEKRISSAETIIGVILPLGKNEDKYSPVNEILEGIRFAVDEFNKTHDDKIGLLVRNSERNREKIFEIRDEFEDIPTLKAIIGPLFSDEVKFANEAFYRTDIPLISPTATENGLTLQNENFFQANPSFETRGKVMANYAFHVDTVRRAAILKASDTYSSKLAQAFAEEFTRLGGEIWVDSDYQSGKYNFKESVNKINQFRDTLQCIYVPVSSNNDAAYVLSYLVIDSLHVDSLNIKIYGNQDWFSSKLLKSSSTIGSNLIFTSDYFIPFRNRNYKQFNRKYFEQNKYDSNRNVLYGYDITKFLLSILNVNGDNVYSVAQALKTSKEVKGIHNNFLFDKNRINSFLNLVKYKNGIFRLIDRYKINE